MKKKKQKYGTLSVSKEKKPVPKDFVERMRNTGTEFDKDELQSIKRGGR